MYLPSASFTSRTPTYVDRRKVNQIISAKCEITRNGLERFWSLFWSALRKLLENTLENNREWIGMNRFLQGVAVNSIKKLCSISVEINSFKLSPLQVNRELFATASQQFNLRKFGSNRTKMVRVRRCWRYWKFDVSLFLYCIAEQIDWTRTIWAFASAILLWMGAS